MKKFLTMLMRHWAKTPVKISLTILSVALGTGILVLSFSAGSILEEGVTDRMSKNGVVLYVTNGTTQSDGSVEMEMPAQWDETASEKLRSESGLVKYAVPVSSVPFDEVSVNGKKYRLRSAVGTGPAYFDVFSLEMLAGSSMTDADLAAGLKKVWISEELAGILYGSAEDAVGKSLQPPGNILRRGPESRSQNMIVTYAVGGVFKTPSEVARRSYGIGDLIFAYTSMIPAGNNATFERRMMASTLVVKTSGAGVEKARASILQTLALSFGEDVKVAVWEGSSRGPSTYLTELRQTISIFTISLSILGVILLIISSLGIFSVMVVESLGRRRDIALERAIGASKGMVVKEFWTWSLALSFIGAVIGLGIAFLISKPVLNTLAPLVGEVSGQFKSMAGLRFGSVLAGLLLALGCGGVLGLLPAFSAVHGVIADVIKEV